VHRIEVRQRLSGDDLAAVETLARAAEAVDGHGSLDRTRFAAARQADAMAALAWAPGRAQPVAFGWADPRPERWELELVVDPALGAEAHPLGGEVLAALLDAVGAAGGGRAHLWVSHVSEAHDGMAGAAGLRPSRDLWQLRRPLPVDASWSLVTRPFRPGQDEDAWLAVNNRAFDWHPEQGAWSLDDIRDREREPWFDPAGFLLHEEDGRLAGFCWTKVHDQHDPPLGEIYVIAVDPAFSGRGLGRSLTLAGLDHLARTGLTVGMLYVDATNGPAVRLYDQLGFTRHHVDRAYEADAGPGGTTPPAARPGGRTGTAG
jgi:mycothiol synthase